MRCVVPGLVPSIHVFVPNHLEKSWMAGKVRCNKALRA
jgi:hypothetical protein